MSGAHSYSRALSPNFPSLHLRHNSFSNPSVSLPTSQLILQSFLCFTYVTAHKYNPFVGSPMSQLILQPFCCFTYVTAHSTTLLLLHVCHSPFSNHSVASPMSQLILQPFCCFTYVTAHSSTLISLHLCHSSFYNPSVASPTPQALHLHHLANCPCYKLVVTLVKHTY